MRQRTPTAARANQRGGFVLGLIVGLLAGLALALGVALYMTKVSLPFIDKVPQRSAEQDAAQAEKDRNWDPNAAFAGKNAQKPAGAASAAATPSAAAPAIGTAGPAQTATADAAATAASAAPAAVQPVTYFVQAGAYARSDDAEQQRANLGMLGMTAKVTEREQAGRTVYRVRVGPFERREDADAAKDRLAEAGVDAAIVRVQR